jgi:hypothetical protein
MNTNAATLGSSEFKWKEEVMLSSGKVVVIERVTASERGGNEWASNRGGFKPREYRLRIPYPSAVGEWIEWKTRKEFATWPEVPLVLDIVAGKVTIFSLVAISNGCEVYSKYVYEMDSWVEEMLPEQFVATPTNLLVGDSKDLPRLVRISEKVQRNSSKGYRRALMRVGPSRKVCG